ncbi:VanW family protein [Lacrimispora sp. 38-1]|uniref:VanW family protein n=1 Tax=Lacrimispora sp. 38-1 TaxID=3125778 RepID=UPI003CFAF8FB
MRQNGRRERKKYGKQRKVKSSYMTLAVLSGVCIFALAAFLLAFVLKEKEQQEETDRSADFRELDHYSWNLKLKYKEQTVSLKNPLSGHMGQQPEDIYLQKEGGAYSLDLSAVKEDITDQVADAASKWNKKPQNAQLTGRDKENDTWIYSEGGSGIQIDEENTVKKIMNLVMEKKFEGEVEVETIVNSPDLTVSKARKQYQVIGTFTTDATNNQNRNNNIQLAVRALDGLVIFPGEEFSFNKTTGNRTVERGYKPAGAYRNGEFVEEPGGGVCQVSSTLYNAIILSGITTTERHPHSFEPSYVTPGEDAMVSYDGYSGPDLRFVNKDTTSVAIRAVFKDKKITISIIARPILEEGVTVSMHSGKVKEYDPPEPNYEEDQTLQPDQEVVITQGLKGTVWKTYLITSKDGGMVKEVYFHTSTYKGKPGLVKRNTTGVVITNTNETVGETVPEETPAPSPELEQETEAVIIPSLGETKESKAKALGPGV